MQRVDRGLVAHNIVQNTYNLHHRKKDTTKSTNLSTEYFTKLSQTAHDDKVVNSSVQIGTVNKTLFGQTVKLQKNGENSSINCQEDFSKETAFNLDLNTINVTRIRYHFPKDGTKISSESHRKICYDDIEDISTSSWVSKHLTHADDDILSFVSNIKHCKEARYGCTTSASDNEPLNLVINSKRNLHGYNQSETKNKVQCGRYPSVISKETSLTTDGAILEQVISHSSNVQSSHIKYKDYGLLLSDLDKILCKSDKDKELLRSVNRSHADSEVNRKVVTDSNLKQEGTDNILDKYVTCKLSPYLSDTKWKELFLTPLWSDVKCNNIKKESGTEEEAGKLGNTNLVTNYNPRLSNRDLKMSGQYPGHSRPPVGTPPPQNVWNHLTMVQNQSNIFVSLLRLLNKSFT